MTCPKCGEVLPENVTTCSFCGSPVQQSAQPTYENQTPYQNPAEEKPENVVGGAVGSLIGALIGGVAIVLFLMAEMVSALSGLIMAICALKGYELLAGKLSKKGIVISLLLMLVVPVVAYMIGLTITFMNELEKEFAYSAGFKESFEFLLELIREDGEMQGQVIKDLLMLYGFTALGAIGTVIDAFKRKKK